jgi:predicted secreted protein
MKVWRGYGSEHSMNLVMIGQFKSVDDARKTKQTIDQLIEKLADKIEVGRTRNRFEDEVFALLKDANIYTLGPLELEQFLYDVSTRIEEDKLILTTDESEVSAFMKLMIDRGAKIEIFSAHDYPDAEYGRGK